MIVKVISTQSYMPELYPETNGRPWAIINTTNKQYINCLKLNEKSGF